MFLGTELSKSYPNEKGLSVFWWIDLSNGRLAIFLFNELRLAEHKMDKVVKIKQENFSKVKIIII